MPDEVSIRSFSYEYLSAVLRRQLPLQGEALRTLLTEINNGGMNLRFSVSNKVTYVIPMERERKRNPTAYRRYMGFQSAYFIISAV